MRTCLPLHSHLQYVINYIREANIICPGWYLLTVNTHLRDKPSYRQLRLSADTFASQILNDAVWTVMCVTLYRWLLWTPLLTVYRELLYFSRDVITKRGAVRHMAALKRLNIPSCTMCAKNETRLILNILYSCKSIAMKFSTWYPDDLSIKSIHNLSHHLSYVFYIHYLTLHKNWNATSTLTLGPVFLRASSTKPLTSGKHGCVHA